MQRLPLHFFCGSVLCNVETCNFGKPERFGQVNYVRSNFRDFGMNRFFFRQLVSAASIGRDLTKLRHKSCTTEVAHARGSSFFGKCKLTMRASSTGLLPHLEQQVCKKGRAKCSLYIYIYIYLSIFLSIYLFVCVNLRHQKICKTRPRATAAACPGFHSGKRTTTATLAAMKLFGSACRLGKTSITAPHAKPTPTDPSVPSIF